VKDEKCVGGEEKGFMAGGRGFLRSIALSKRGGFGSGDEGG
jgi:hypothetical protein